MKITKETVNAVIDEMLADNKSIEEIEENFKAALKEKMINIDIYYLAIEKLYS